MTAKKLAKILLNWKFGRLGKPEEHQMKSDTMNFCSSQTPEPTMQLWKVNINSTQGWYQKHVFAKSAKLAIIAAIESAPHDHPVFNFPGWNLSCGLENNAFIVEGKTL